MKYKQVIFISALVAVLLIGALLQKAFTTSAVLAQKSEQATAFDGQTWEYCALSRSAYVGSSRGGLFWISYFRESGVQVVEVEDTAVERNGPAKAMAKLGEEGWELVGEGTLDIGRGSIKALFFKRPK